MPFSTFRILLATDNHIGYAERDPIRGQDSFQTFREILEIAKQREVDFVLLAGDLFHENRPSRECLHQVLAMLREFSLGDKPVQVSATTTTTMTSSQVEAVQAWDGEGYVAGKTRGSFAEAVERTAFVLHLKIKRLMER